MIKNKITFDGLMWFLVRTIFPIIMGMMISATSIVARQDGLPEWVSMLFLFSGLIISLYGLWNILMSFTYEMDYYHKKISSKNPFQKKGDVL